MATGKRSARRARSWILPLVAVVLVGLAALGRSGPVASFYLRSVFPVVADALGRLFSLLPLPASEIATVVLAAWVVVAFVRSTTLLALRRRTPRAAIRRAVRSGMLAASVATIAFVVLGGVFVAVPPVETRLGLVPGRLTSEDLVRAALAIAPSTNEARRRLGRVPHLLTLRAKEWLRDGRTDGFPFDPPEVERAARLAVTRAVEILDGRKFDRFAKVRPLVPDTLLRAIGPDGVTNPGFGEVMMSPYVSAFLYAELLPHELSHAAGIVREREADFYAFVGAWTSDAPLLRYAVLLDATARLASGAQLSGANDAWKRVGGALDPVVRDDVRLRSALLREDAFAPGARFEVRDNAVVMRTKGRARGHLSETVQHTIGTTVGLPPDYDKATALIAAWVLRERGDGPR